MAQEIKQTKGDVFMKIIRPKEVAEIGDIVTYNGYDGEFIVTPCDGTIILINLVSFKRLIINESLLDKYVQNGTIKVLIKYKDIVISSK